ncbi:YihY/virulence factor BrkB family protein [Calidifontibacter terrae]
MSVDDTLRRALGRVRGAPSLARLIRETIRVCMQYRVTGLAAEAGFFALLSFPPLIFGLLGGVGYLSGWLGENAVVRVTTGIEEYASRFLTEDSLREVLMPTISDALHGGRPDVISIGFVLSLWSGSRAVNVMIDTVAIMYGQGGHRGIVRTRVMSLSLYFVSLIFAAIVVPLIVIGPQLLSDWLPDRLTVLMVFYWPLVGGLTILGFATFFYLATPRKTPWVRDLPGAVLTLVIWVLAAMGLRWVLGNSVGGTTIYGPLAAAIVVLIWLYFLGIAVLIGAALNAATMRLWPVPEHTPAHERARERLQESVQRTRARISRTDGVVVEHADGTGPEADHPDDEAVTVPMLRRRSPQRPPVEPDSPVTPADEATPSESPGDSRPPRLDSSASIR